MRSPNITKSPAEEVKSNRRGMGQPSPVHHLTSPMKTPVKSSSRPNTPAGVGRGGKKRTLRKNELSLLNDEASNFMFPKAKEDVDSDSSDVIIIVKGKKKTKSKAGEASNSNVDDQTMALIKREMGEEDALGEVDAVESTESIAKVVNLLPLKKRFGVNSKSMKLKEAPTTTTNSKQTATSKEIVKAPGKGKKAATNKKGAMKVVKVEPVSDEEEVSVVKEEPEEVPVAKGSKKKGGKAAANKKKPPTPPMVQIKAEMLEEVVQEEVTPEPPVTEKPNQKKATKVGKKETAKARRKREKLERELSLIVKTEPEDHQEVEEPAKIEEEEEYSNLSRIIEAEEVTRFKFAFERVPSMEPWFAAFNRQDEGEERIFEYYGSTSKWNCQTRHLIVLLFFHFENSWPADDKFHTPPT